ncbi:hypothetical protein C2S52_018118 [Perilla frutescens var. hirtella]|nr:hypothetical protein C2S52_018118 [Perilla frutescens var. hirtella]KAH6811856.1 hypothetical protein C2S51_025618 [Perilla frutescens var. frutescens]
MSGIVDIWTTELAKLKNKEAVLSSGSAPPPVAHADQKSSGSLWWPTGLAQALRVEKLPALHCSETSLSLLLDIISA